MTHGEAANLNLCQISREELGLIEMLQKRIITVSLFCQMRSQNNLVNVISNTQHKNIVESLSRGVQVLRLGREPQV